MSPSKNNSLLKLIFFGNYFYGICAVALSTEAALQQHAPLNDIIFYLMTFSLTVLYYTKAYLPQRAPKGNNERSVWYYDNRQLMLYSQVLFTIILLLGVVWFLKSFWDGLLNMNLTDWLLIIVFPVAGAFYYGLDNKAFGKINLRKIGWLKPFIIGFVWAGQVTIYPLLYADIESKLHYAPTFIGCLLFLKNFMFVTVLCIMFDVKDYATDHNQHLQTFVVKFGLRRTIFYILIPLCILGLGSFLTYGTLHHFSLMKIILNTIPFISLIAVAYSLHRRKPIFYYLILIDGLMLVKAVCGSIAMVYF
jgi:hypothetical protein